VSFNSFLHVSSPPGIKCIVRTTQYVNIVFIYYGFHIIFAPKGISASFAILKHCNPKGIPIIVQHRSKPFKAAARAMGIPQKSSQIIFAINDGALPPYLISFLPRVYAVKGSNDYCYYYNKADLFICSEMAHLRELR